jgi:bifunctional non-homologous end joining protein LigD
LTTKNIVAELKKIGAVKAPFPSRIDPMLATKITNVFDDPGYLYEVKWDGYRIITYKNKHNIKLRSRKFENYTHKYSTVVDTLSSFSHSFVFDGEIVYFDEKGKPSFDLLQKVKSIDADRLSYCVFDILWLDGYSLLNVPLIQRKRILKLIFNKPIQHITNDFYVDGNGNELFEQVLQQDMEGIVAKKKDSIYLPGARSKQWLKVQTKIRQEFVIGGWSESESGRDFKSILFGYYDNDGKFIFYGHSGGGYTDKTAKELKHKLLKIEIKKKPFANEVESRVPVHWVKPMLVAEFEYATTTKSGKIRKPAIFKGLRSDKEPTEIRLDIATNPPKKQRLPAKFSSIDSNWKAVKQSLELGSKNVITIDNHDIELNDIEKVLWQKQGITKGALINYYIKIAPYILPYLKDRPLSLHIKHHAVGAPGLYIKDMENNQPGWATTFTTVRKHKKQGKGDSIEYLVCNDLATLVWMLNLNCIDVNPWNSRVQTPQFPDYFVIDLDPTDSPFEQVVECAIAAKKVLDKYKLVGLAKTSGKTGMHIFIPVDPVFTFEQARMITSKICSFIQEEVPDISTVDDTIAKRDNKVFLDDNQNDYTDTVASAYSVRPYRIPTVSTPLHWKEINSRLDPTAFTIETIENRLKKKGDLYKKLFDKKFKLSNTAIIKKLIDKDL